MAFKKRPHQKGLASSRGLHWNTNPRLLSVCCVCGFVQDNTEQGDQKRSMPPMVLQSTTLLSSIALIFTHTYCPDCLEAVRQLKRPASSGKTSEWLMPRSMHGGHL